MLRMRTRWAQTQPHPVNQQRQLNCLALPQYAPYVPVYSKHTQVCQGQRLTSVSGDLSHLSPWDPHYTSRPLRGQPHQLCLTPARPWSPSPSTPPPPATPNPPTIVTYFLPVAALTSVYTWRMWPSPSGWGNGAVGIAIGIRWGRRRAHGWRQEERKSEDQDITRCMPQLPEQQPQ